MTTESIIISMTSYPARITDVGIVWYSILRQVKPEYNVHCVLVLSEEEFSHKENDLPPDLRTIISSGKVELLWTPRNTRSHKKLMPTIAKYPNNPILIIDDDQLRPNGWLKQFIDDHTLWPTDVIAGRIKQREINGKFVWKDIAESERGQLIPYGRSQNGRGGTLYPAHIFIDPEFFDEKLYMKYSPTSDESWQYYWMRKHKLWPRATRAYIDDVAYVIQSAQNELALWSINRGKYDSILETLIKRFG